MYTYHTILYWERPEPNSSDPKQGVSTLLKRDGAVGSADAAGVNGR